MTQSNIRRPTLEDALDDHRQEDEEDDDGLDGDNEPERLPIVLTDGRREAVDRLQGLRVVDVDGALEHPLITLETVRESRLQDESDWDGQTPDHDEDDAQHPRTFARSHQVTVHDALEMAVVVILNGDERREIGRGDSG